MFWFKYGTKINRLNAQEHFVKALRRITVYGAALFLVFGLLWILWLLYPDWTGFRNKTLWDLIELLIVPLVLTGGALWFNFQERNAERDNLTERMNEATLQAYFDKITELLLWERLFDENFRHDQPGKYKTVSNVARARTLSAMNTLDGGRKRHLLDFLYETESITRGMIDLRGADLRDAPLSMAQFPNANLSGVNLEKTHLRHSELENTDLSDASLQNADLTAANLKRARLSRALLEGAVLTSAEMIECVAHEAYFSQADLRCAKLNGADLSRSQFIKADLTAAEFKRAKLIGVEFQGANLNLADLQDADLTDANFYGALVTIEQLLKAKCLQGVTMPDGNKYQVKAEE